MLNGGLLIIEDNETNCKEIEAKAREFGFTDILTASSSEEAKQIWDKNRRQISIVVLDLKLGSDRTAGWRLLEKFRNERRSDDFEVLIYSGTFRDIETALDAIRPTTITLFKKNADEDDLWDRLKLLAGRFASAPNVILSPEEAADIDALSESSIPVLIYGPPGTGKTMKAFALANSSGCDEDRIMPINCANLTPELAESVLFGATKGAFTGSTQDKAGKMMLASGFASGHLRSDPALPIVKSPKGFKAYQSNKEQWGAVILDEIGSLDPIVQAKLLLVLEGEPIQPLGWAGRTAGFLPNFRVIAVTNDIDSLRTRFRPDLLRRIASWAIQCSELGDEPDHKIEDIVIQQTKVPRRLNGRLTGMIKPRLDPHALKWLLKKKSEVFGGYREMQWIIQRAWVISRKKLPRIDSVDITLEDIKEAWDFSADISSQLDINRLASNGSSQQSTQVGVNELRSKIAVVLHLEADKINQRSFSDGIADLIKNGVDREELKKSLKEVFLEGLGKKQLRDGYAALGFAIRYNMEKASQLNKKEYGKLVMDHFTGLFRRPK